MRSRHLLFDKLVGAGNDFIFFDQTGDVEQGLLKELLKNNGLSRAGLAERICRRHFGIGADGVVYLESPKNKENDFAWDFYNSDGTNAEMCGNAARCLGLYLHKKRGIIGSTKLLTSVGTINLEVSFLGSGQGKAISPEKVNSRVHMPTARIINDNLSIVGMGGGDGQILGSLVDTGVPHFVVKSPFDLGPMIPDGNGTSDLRKREEKNIDHPEPRLLLLAKYLREKVGNENRGANITFFTEVAPLILKVITFERGVENFTLACGTGATAAAYVFLTGGGASLFKAASTKWRQSIRTIMPGGALEVECLCGPSGKMELILSGDVDWLFEGHLLPEAVL